LRSVDAMGCRKDNAARHESNRIVS